MLYILIFLFATCSPNVIHAVTDQNLEATRILVMIVNAQWEMTVAKMYRSLAWWRLKLMAFHVTMLTAFVLSKIWYLGKGIIVTALFLATYPLLLYCPQIIYWWAITFSTLGFMYVDAVRIILQALDTRARIKERDKYMITPPPHST